MRRRGCGKGPQTRSPKSGVGGAVIGGTRRSRRQGSGIVVGCHIPPRAERTPRAFNSAASARTVPCPMPGAAGSAASDWPQKHPPAGASRQSLWQPPLQGSCGCPAPRPGPWLAPTHARPLRNYRPLYLRQRGIEVQRERIDVRPQLSDHGRHALCSAISPEMKCTSRDSRSSFAPTTAACAFLACARASRSFGRRSRASLPLPVSTSTCSAMTSGPRPRQTG
jgi:hypothetical protein